MTDARPEQAWFAKADEDLEMASHSLRTTKNPLTSALASTRCTPTSTASITTTPARSWTADPIVRREDQTRFAGGYRIRDLILAYMSALAAGDNNAVISL